MIMNAMGIDSGACQTSSDAKEYTFIIHNGMLVHTCISFMVVVENCKALLAIAKLA